MADEDHGRHFDGVVALLAHNRRIAGTPSYKAIDSLSKELEGTECLVCGIRVERVPRSTVHGLFTRSCRRIPRWKLMEPLWATLYRYAEIKGRDVHEMVSLADLKKRYREAEAAAIEAPQRMEQSTAGPVPAISAGLDDRRGADAPMNPLDWSAHLSFPATAHGVANGVPGRRQMWEVDGRFIAELQARSRHAAWRTYMDVIPDWFELYVMSESELAEIRTYAPLRVPSLLQIGEYARRVIAADLPGVNERGLRRRVELRLLRQGILDRPDAPKLWTIIHERALDDDAGSPPVRQAQIRHLIGLASRPNITIQIMPADQANAAFADGPLAVMRFPESHINDMIFLEQREHALYLNSKRDLSYYSKLFSSFLITALSPDASIRFMHSLL